MFGFLSCLLKASYLIAILTRNRKNSSRMSKTIKLTQRQRSEPAQRYLAFTLIPSQIFSHFALYRHFAYLCHGMVCIPTAALKGVLHISTKSQTLLRMTNHNLVVISDLGGVECWCLRGVAESNSPLPIFSWLLTVTSLSPPHHASHPSLRSLLSADTGASVHDLGQSPGQERELWSEQEWGMTDSVITISHDIAQSQVYRVWTAGHS